MINAVSPAFIYRGYIFNILSLKYLIILIACSRKDANPDTRVANDNDAITTISICKDGYALQPSSQIS